MQTWYQKLETFNTTEPDQKRKHVTVEIPFETLPELFKKDIVLLPLSQNSPLYKSDSPLTQYEPVTYDDTKIIHYTVQTGDQNETTNIGPYWKEYIETGSVKYKIGDENSTLHELPLPIHHIVAHRQEFMSCVTLKNGHRALAYNEHLAGHIIEGTKAPERQIML